MGETTGDNAEASEPTTSEPVEIPVDVEVKKTNATNAALRKRLRELEADSAELQKLRDGNKSELEKASERITQAENRALAAEQQALRLEVATSKGLTASQAKRLIGATREELESDADEIVESFGPPATRPPGIPAIALQSGSVARDDQAPQDANAWLRAAVANATS